MKNNLKTKKTKNHHKGTNGFSDLVCYLVFTSCECKQWFLKWFVEEYLDNPNLINESQGFL